MLVVGVGAEAEALEAVKAARGWSEGDRKEIPKRQRTETSKSLNISERSSYTITSDFRLL